MTGYLGCIVILHQKLLFRGLVGMPNLGLAAVRRLLLNICIAFFSTAITLALIELTFLLISYYDDVKTVHAVQNLGQIDKHLDPKKFYTIRQLIRLSKNRRIIYELIPRISLSFRNKRYTINAHGFRGPDYGDVK